MSHVLAQKIRVLVVDDSALMRKLIPQILQRDPAIEVIGTAMDGAIGLKKIAELRPNVVTLDLNMPRMDGLTLIRSLRGLTSYQRVPILMLTTEFSDEMKAKGKAAGANGWLVKPFDPQRLTEVVKKVIG